jgi:hypothetical protein
MKTFPQQLKLWGLITLFVCIGIYTFIQMRGIWQGVVIDIPNLEPYTVVSESLYILQGTAKHATNLTVNDRRIYIDEQGAFTDQLLLLPGYSILTIRAEDTFGNVREKQFAFYNTEEKPVYEIPLEEPVVQEDIIQINN